MKSDYRNDNVTMVNYYNNITKILFENGLENENTSLVRTDTRLYVTDNEEHFVIEVELKNRPPQKDINNILEVLEKDVLPDYMEAFYNVVDFKIRLVDETGKTEDIERVYQNMYLEIESEEQSL